MKILCCVKIVADFDSGSGNIWDIADNNVDLTFYPKQLNCFDASGLELALRCAEKAGEPVEIVVLTLSDGSDARFFKPLLALGVSECCMIRTDRDLRFAPDWTAGQIAAFVREHPFDVLLFGGSQSIGRNSAAGIMVSELLGRPCLSGVTGFALEEDGLYVSGVMDEARFGKLAPAGSVLITDESLTLPLRTPTLRQKLAVSGREPVILDPYTEEEQDRAPQLLRLYREDSKGSCCLLSPEDFSDCVLKLFMGERS